MNIDVLRTSFGSAPFNVREASVALGLGLDSSRVILRDMRVRGLLERVGRGEYRVAPVPRRRPIDDRLEALRIERALDVPLRIALDGPDAVRIWSRGRYMVGTHLGVHIVHVAVEAEEMDRFRAHLDANGIRHGNPDDRPRGGGPFIVLRPVEGLRRTVRGGLPVLTKEATRDLVKEHPTAYEGAEEWFE